MKDVSKELVEAFVDGCRRAAGSGLMLCSSGNISMRVDDGRMLIKASRSWMAHLTPAEVSLCRIADGARIDGGKPSVEIGFHAGILRARPEVNVVMHFQTPAATALACLPPERIDFFVIPEIPFYIGPVARIPYLAPGSEALAAAVTEAMRTHDMGLMDHHGQVTVAADMDHAIQSALFFELACRIILQSGDRAAPLPSDAVRDLLAARRGAGAAGV
jgi:ribulose-5-phosphate 4-epimerase/fuculose-1-phosphate aldolase